jgi:spore coat polysaccharide biosynthesis protein SpsF
MKVGIIIQARLSSTRLQEKILLPFYNNESVINILIKRLKKNKHGIPIILATTENPLDDRLVQVAFDEKILVFRGDERNVLDRFIKAAATFKISHAIRVCSDNPFLSLSHIEELYTMGVQSDFDYISYKINEKPSIRSHIGILSEFVTIDCLKRAQNETEELFHLEHVTYYIHSNPDKFKIWLKPFEIGGADLSTIRLTLDTLEDFNLLQSIYKKLRKACPDEEIRIQHILDILTPAQMQRMQTVISLYTK